MKIDVDEATGCMFLGAPPSSFVVIVHNAELFDFHEYIRKQQIVGRVWVSHHNKRYNLWNISKCGTPTSSNIEIIKQEILNKISQINQQNRIKLKDNFVYKKDYVFKPEKKHVVFSVAGTFYIMTCEFILLNQLARDERKQYTDGSNIDRHSQTIGEEYFSAIYKNYIENTITNYLNNSKKEYQFINHEMSAFTRLFSTYHSGNVQSFKLIETLLCDKIEIRKLYKLARQNWPLLDWNVEINNSSMPFDKWIRRINEEIE